MAYGQKVQGHSACLRDMVAVTGTATGVQPDPRVMGTLIGISQGVQRAQTVPRAMVVAATAVDLSPRVMETMIGLLQEVQDTGATALRMVVLLLRAGVLRVATMGGLLLILRRARLACWIDSTHAE